MRLAPLLAVLVCLAFEEARSDTWYSTRPRTGSPCASWEWRGYAAAGFMFFRVFTPDSTVAITQGDWASRVRCRCLDSSMRYGPWSPISATHIPTGLWALWMDMGLRSGSGALTMTVSGIAATEASWPDSLR